MLNQALGLKPETFYGNDGYLELKGGPWKAFHGREKEPFAGSKDGRNGDVAAHGANFIDAVRAGNDKLLRSDINEGFYSSALPLMSNISYRLGARELTFNDKTEKFDNEPEANKMLSRNYRHPYVVPSAV
jgi:hypothetical protein